MDEPARRRHRRQRLGRRVVTDRGRAWRTIETQWPQIAADLDHGTPAALAVVTVASASPADLGVNHQVLAYGYDASASEVTVRVYDPNSGQSDGIYIRFDPRAPAEPTTFADNLDIGHPVRGFFRTAYAPARPPGSYVHPPRDNQKQGPAAAAQLIRIRARAWLGCVALAAVHCPWRVVYRRSSPSVRARLTASSRLCTPSRWYKRSARSFAADREMPSLSAMTRRAPVAGGNAESGLPIG